MQVLGDAQPEIQRHRAAIRRGDFSLPLKCVLRDGLLDRDDSFFDYGCGHGDDIRHLRRQGFDCDGWDPVHRPDVPRLSADTVNLGYVLNVIEDVQERAQTLRDAWQLCRKALIVAARISVGDGGQFGAEYSDGVLTRLGTFQKLYTQAELREYLQDVLATEAVPAAPGVFYVFKDEELAQRYFAARCRRRGATPPQRISERRFDQHRDLLEPLMAKIAELGRLPFADEWPETAAVNNALGSMKRAFALIRRVTGEQPWAEVRQQRMDDLTVYLALSRFRKRPPLGSLPLDLQRDIREFFGTYKRACEAADACLFQTGNPAVIDQACQESPLGRLTTNALLVHKSAVDELAPILRIYEGCARAYLGEIDDANIVKLHRFSGKISYLACPDFDGEPHPAIRRTVKLTLGTRQLVCFDHSSAPSPLVLDRKEAFVEPEYPKREQFVHFTQHEAAHGLLDDVLDLATWARWQERFDQAGLELRGNRLLWKPGEKRRRPRRTVTVGRIDAAEPPVMPPTSASVDMPGAEDLHQPGDQRHEHNGTNIGMPGKKPTITAPSRSRRYGIGKQIGGSVYVHRQYEHVLGPVVAGAKQSLPADFHYDVVKFNQRTQAVSFIQCPQFDQDPEPAIAAVTTIRADGTIRFRKFRDDDPLIYHHKWLFVADDYPGFDVEESKRRSAAWLALPNIDTSRIGRQSYWRAEVLGEFGKGGEDMVTTRPHVATTASGER